MKKIQLCPCCSTLDYAVCCGRYHKGNINPPTAEALMRSRYTAYAMGNAQYIYRTWHEKTRPTLPSLRKSEPQKLVALKILSTQEGTENDSKGMVEFVASYESPSFDESVDKPVGEPIEQHHEKSLFAKIKGNWVYIDRI